MSQEGVNCRDHLGALSYRSGDPLDRSGADVTDRKNAGAARLERSASIWEICIRAHEALVIERDAVS